MRIVFAGTPHAAVPTLEALADSEHEVSLVVTRDDAPRGRRRQLAPSPVAQRAAELGLPVFKTNSLGQDATDRIRSASPDIGVIVAYGALVRSDLLQVPQHGWVNLHFSALPRWRGAAPVQQAIIHGDTSIGASVFQLVEALDEGDVWGTETEPIPADATAGDVLDSLSRSGAGLMLRSLDTIAAGQTRPTPQSGQSTYAAKLTPPDARLPVAESADVVYARFRGVTPAPGAFVVNADTEERIKIHQMSRAPLDAPQLEPGTIREHGGQVLLGTGTAPLALIRIQPPGKKSMNAADWWRGLRHAIRVK